VVLNTVVFRLPVRATTNQEIPSIYVEKGQTGGLPGGSACLILPSSDHVFWRTDEEVDLERNQNYCMDLFALYLRRTIVLIHYSMR